MHLYFDVKWPKKNNSFEKEYGKKPRMSRKNSAYAGHYTMLQQLCVHFDLLISASPCSLTYLKHFLSHGTVYIKMSKQKSILRPKSDTDRLLQYTPIYIKYRYFIPHSGELWLWRPSRWPIKFSMPELVWLVDHNLLNDYS